MNKFCGLDFGTSNSTVGLKTSQGFELATLEGASPILPSAIFFDQAGGGKLYGRQAIHQYIEGAEGRLMQSVKSILGSDIMTDGTFVQGRNVKFEAIIGHLVGHLKAQAEKQTGAPLDSVVMGRPVHFNDNNKELDQQAEALLKQIARNQGFKQVEFQFEPIAAALSYEQKSVTQETLALIADIGGGTSDFSVVMLGSNNPDRKQDILANAGVHIGGTDFDRRISVQEVMPHFGMKTLVKTMSGKSVQVPKSYFHDMATWHRINSLYSHKTKDAIAAHLKHAENSVGLERFDTLLEYELGHLLNTCVEEQKQILSSQTESVLPLDFVQPEFNIPMTQTQTNAAIQTDLTKLSAMTEEILKQAGTKAQDIDVVFFTGGSTKIPVLRQHITAQVPQAQVVEGDAFGSVGYGLAVDAEQRFR